jgi:RHS repeat-associated protein
MCPVRTKTWTQTYTYDGVNRLKTAVETGQSDDWSQTYDYTATGNRYVSASTNFSLGTFTASASTQFDAGNHLTISGLVYDDAGNQTQMGSGLTMAYDADGRMQSSTLNGLTTYYVYDADGHRVMKMTGPASTTYVYDAFGQLVMEVGGDSAPTCTTCFLTVDALGSTRQVTDSSTGLPVGCHDYLPFGEELGGIAGRTDSCWTATDTTLKFTGKERDTDTAGSGNVAGLDYFGARYFSSAQGRFTSPDEPFADWDQRDPQSWNLYGYVRNNPLRFTDLTGNACTADWKDDDRPGQSCQEVRDQDKNRKPDIVVGVGKDEADKIAAAMLYEQLTSPHQWAQVISGGGLGAASVLAPGPTAIVQCATGNCSGANLAMAVIPEAGPVAKITRWGWPGTKKFLAAVRLLKQPGTHEALEGIVPTLEEAKQLIQQAGGTIDRIEEGHAVGGVSEHTYPHINYTTPSGSKATVKVESVK